MSWSDAALRIKGKFFSLESCGKYGQPLPSQRRQILMEYLSQCIPECILKRNVLENEVIIHIRSGDCFSSPTNRHYILPPLSYYQFILTNLYPGRPVRIVTEKDRKNPCIKGLREWRPDIRVQTLDLLQDVNTLLRSLYISFLRYSCLGGLGSLIILWLLGGLL